MNKHLHMMEKVTYIKENGLQSSKTVMEELYKWSELECLRKHVKFRLFKVYGIAELSQDGIEESDIDAELYFAFCKAVERYQLHDDLPETEEEKMFITYCHRYMDGDVKRFIEKENRISHYYTWLLMRSKQMVTMYFQILKNALKLSEMPEREKKLVTFSQKRVWND